MSSKVFKQVIIKTMKKKIIIASATVLFAVATVFNMNLLQGNSVGNISLESIAVMARANGGEDGNSEYAAERKYVEGGFEDFNCPEGKSRWITYWGFDCIGRGNLACTVSIAHSSTGCR